MNRRREQEFAAPDTITTIVVELLRRHLRDPGDEHGFPMHINLTELGLDSVSAVSLIVDLEESLDINLPESMISPSTFKTASTLRDALYSLTDRPIGG